MKPSIIWTKSGIWLKGCLLRLGPVLFWLAIWQLIAAMVNQRILLISPTETVMRLWSLMQTPTFWDAIGLSAGRILAGFGLAVFLGTLLAALASTFRWIRTLLAPFLTTVKSVPMASFIIIALIWVSSHNLSMLIAFLVALPAIYAGILEGILQVDSELVEMTRLFRVSIVHRWLHLYLPEVLPHFRTTASVAMGLAWKAGIAAEVIGIPNGSIGEHLYEVKVYLATSDLFAWTLAIILLSTLCEHTLRGLLWLIMRRFGRR